MNVGELISIKTLEDEQNLYGGRERHTPYCAEIRLFSCVQQGDLKKLMSELQNIDSSIITGKMSDNDLMQYKYMRCDLSRVFSPKVNFKNHSYKLI